MSSPGRVLVVEDGQSRGAVGAVRALAATGWVVGVAAPGLSPAGVSNATRRAHRVPALGDGAEAFLDAVAASVRAERYDVVFGAGDAEVYALSAGRARLGAALACPPHDVVLGTLDKGRLPAAASRAGLRTPVSIETSGLAGRPGPFVVKPLVHGGVGHTGSSRMEARRVPDGDAALLRVRELEATGREAVVQEAVEGELQALVLLIAQDGRLVAAVQQRAERLQPPQAGVSARAVTIPVDEDLLARAVAFLRASGWWGLAELQLLVGTAERPVLIDVNGRIYGSLALALAAGINLPDLWARLALDLPAPTAGRGRPGVRYQWLEGDLRAAIALREGGLVRDVVATLARGPRSAHSTLSLRDPLPGIYASGRLAARAVTRGHGRMSPQAR